MPALATLHNRFLKHFAAANYYSDLGLPRPQKSIPDQILFSFHCLHAAVTCILMNCTIDPFDFVNFAGSVKDTLQAAFTLCSSIHGNIVRERLIS